MQQLTKKLNKSHNNAAEGMGNTKSI